MFYRFLSLFSLAILIAGCKKDRLKWQQVVSIPSQTSARLNQIFFIDDTTGFIPGGERFSQALILKTVDGGWNWHVQEFPEAGKELFNVCRAPGGTLYAIGFDGKLLQSSDGGLSWTFRQLWYRPYKDLYFSSGERGVAIGGISYKAGFITEIFAPEGQGEDDSLDYELNDLEMVNGRTGFLAGFGVIARTDDSGRSWQEQDIRNDNFTAIHARNEYEAWTCGYNGSIWKTNDGGQTWQRMRNGNDISKPRYRLLAICMKNALEGFACGEDGLVIYTDDGGHHWMEFDRFTERALRSMHLFPDGRLLLAGDGGALYQVRFQMP